MDLSQVKDKLQKFDECIAQLNKVIERITSNIDNYENLSTANKVQYDLFVAYIVNTLYWLKLKVEGQDPNNSEVKNQLQRVREYMQKAKVAQRREKRVKIDQGAAKRFIKNAINIKDNDGFPLSKRAKHS